MYRKMDLRRSSQASCHLSNTDDFATSFLYPPPPPGFHRSLGHAKPQAYPSLIFSLHPFLCLPHS